MRDLRLPKSFGGFSWLVFWSALTLVFDVIISWGALWQLAAQGYPSVPGVVTHSKVDCGEDGDSYRPDIHYDYTVAGVRYAGVRYRYGQWGSNDNSARRTVDQHPVGKEVAVYYNPADPADAVLAAGLQGTDLLLAMFMTPFNLVMVGGWWGVWNDRRRAGPGEPFAGLPVTRRGGRVCLRQPDPRLILAAAAGGFVPPILLVIGIAVCAGFDPPLPVMLGAWTVVLGVGIVVHRLVAPPAFLSKLILDDQDGQVKVFRNCRWSPDLVVPVSSVAAVSVATVEDADNQGAVRRVYVTTLAYTDDNGAPQQEPLEEWTEPELAESLAAGIRDWLAGQGHVLPDSSLPAAP
jgi:Protein of unknown function (DUF3592)